MPLIAADPTDKSPPILAVLHPSETLLKFHNGTLSQLSSSPNAQSITMEHPSKVTALATSIDGKLVAFGYTDGSVILHSFPDAGDNGANHPMFDDPDEDAYDSLLTQNDGLSDSEDDADTPSRKTIYNGPKLDGNITSLLFLNTRYLAIASSSPHAGHSICVVDASTPATLLETGKLLGDFTVGEGVASVAYNKNVLSCLTTDGRLVCFKCPLDAEDPELEWEELDATRTTVGCGNVSMGYERTSGVVLAAVSSGREEGTVGVYKVGSDGGDAEEGCLNKTEEKG
eukprot:CAMPEP_0194367812 /NCGR_PEP_ID=MMETSP0174-20130528/15983_1 /TAXON_ID=216777 /ORGANISM="Proboscia alata, Strain PI-D3" /LENGTH=284 /DNA_ID=CAMNT_0039143833 /DNA_START=124 /DNA_END=975 /DNA_ORIENTATION=-